MAVCDRVCERLVVNVTVCERVAAWEGVIDRVYDGGRDLDGEMEEEGGGEAVALWLVEPDPLEVPEGVPL